jgi:tetratricopeptide (TPR) repeat protein
LQIRFTIAQLYLVQEKWQQGVDALIEWMNATESPAADAYALLAQGYYQLKQYDKALTNIDKSIGMFKAQNKQPKENWYNLAAFLWSEKNNYDKVIDVLRETLQYYPKKQYWLQLSAMYGEKKKDAVQLAALEALYVDGKLTEERELVQLAYMYLANDIPYLAAKVLDKGVSSGKIDKTEKNLELLGNAWRAAQEVKKSIPVMEQAAAKSSKGEIWARLGNVYLDNEEYDKSAKAIRSALQKGGIKSQDMAYLTLGMANFNLKQYGDARKAFEQAQKGSQAKPYATQWLTYLDKEEERLKSLEEL